MPPIKSINAPREVLPSAQPLQPKILTSAIPEPPKPTTTLFTNERVVAMMPFRDSVVLATERGVYIFDLAEAIFKPVKFEIVEEPTE